MTGTNQAQQGGSSLLEPQSPVELLHVPSAVTCQAAVVALQHLSLQTLVYHLSGSDTQYHRGQQHNTAPCQLRTHTYTGHPKGPSEAGWSAGLKQVSTVAVQAGNWSRTPANNRRHTPQQASSVAAG